MGRSDYILFQIYKEYWPNTPPIALLGFTQNVILSEHDVDLYDLSLNNWNINEDWNLKHKEYNSIISTRCPYFAKDPEHFIIKCYEHLNNNGTIFLSWEIGAHFSIFNNNFKVGWKRGNEHEWFYKEGNFLWSTVWDDALLEHQQYKIFENRVRRFGYNNVKQAIFDEVPSIITIDFIKQYFDISYETLALWEDYPQLTTFIRGTKK